MPKQWKDSREFVADLRNCGWRMYFDEERSNKLWHDWGAIITGFVAGNTFRAFHHMPEPPSTVFRQWAHDALFGRFHFYGAFLNLGNPSGSQRVRLGGGRLG
jgi:hypothetical protein